MASKKSKTKKLSVELTKEFKSGDRVIYTNWGRFKPSRSGRVEISFELNGEDKKIKVNHA